MSNDNQNPVVSELSDDIEVVGPGAMLAQAREAIHLSQQQVADKLNFRLVLVKDIENEVFDKSIPATFIRGYLRSYAKLVDLSSDDVLASYQMLNIAQQQGAEMQSFSKGTEKQAESNRIMWISYLILALLIASTIVWWLQQGKMSNPESANVSNEKLAVVDSLTKQTSGALPLAITEVVLVEKTPESVEAEKVSSDSKKLNDESLATDRVQALGAEKLTAAVEQTSALAFDNAESSLSTRGNTKSDIEFTFSGDCWVNIYDDSGERLAWGIKKAGYVMSISGTAPFNVTLGKPELVAIKYNDDVIDLSQFNRGNIAKFSLPLE